MKKTLGQELENVKKRLDVLEEPRKECGPSPEQLESRLKEQEDKLSEYIGANDQAQSRAKSLPIYQLAIFTAFLVMLFATVIHDQHTGMSEIAAAINAQTLRQIAATKTVSISMPPGDGKRHELEVELLAPCWLKVSAETGIAVDGGVAVEGYSTLTEGNQSKGYKREFTFQERARVEIRASCPGSVLYRVNGVEITPVNKSGKPKDSEVVELTL